MQTYVPNAAKYRGEFGWLLPAVLILALLVYWRFDQPRLVLDDEGYAVLRWSGQLWTETQMRELVATLNLKLTEIPGRLGSGDIHRRYPNALGAWESHHGAERVSPPPTRLALLPAPIS